MAMSIVTSFFVIASLRTNILLVLILLFVDLAFLMLTACYWNLARGIATVAQHLQIVGSFSVSTLCRVLTIID
jgi:hypothetical protein